MLEQDFTVVILTSCKRSEIFDICKYWVSRKVKVVVLATDSRIYSLLKNLNIEHIYVNKSFEKRFNFAAEVISTPFSALHPDDDLIIFEFAEKGISWLKNNNSYSSISGSVAWVNHNQVTGHWVNKKNLNNKGRINLRKHLTDYKFGYFYAVHKTENLKIIMQSVAHSLKLIQGEDRYLELIIEISSAYVSNMKILNRVHILKRYNNKILYDNDESASTSELLKSGANKSEIEECARAISDVLIRNPLINSKSKIFYEDILKQLTVFPQSNRNWENFSELLFKEKLNYLYIKCAEFILLKIYRSLTLIIQIFVKAGVVEQKIFVPWYSIKSLRNINKVFRELDTYYSN
jgi:hypothetical protein